MARVRRCDRCDKYYEPYSDKDGLNNVGTAGFNMDNEEDVVTTFYDLCPECMGEFTTWLHDVKGKEIGMHG